MLYCLVDESLEIVREQLIDLLEFILNDTVFYNSIEHGEDIEILAFKGYLVY